MMFKIGAFLVTVWASCLLLTQASILTDEELKELRDAPLVSIKVKDRSPAPGRSIEDTLMMLKRMCQCQGKGCGCCTEFEVSFFSVEGCMNVTLIPKDKAFEVSLSAGGKSVFKHKISVRQLEKVCGTVGDVNDLEICLFTTLEEETANGLISCMSLDIKYQDILLANINFHCLKYVDGKLSFVENEKTVKDALANLNIKNPFHVLAKLMKAVISKLEEVPTE